MSGFAKQTVCPSSAVLSAYVAGTLSFLARRGVADHLAACEFCEAESAFWLSLGANDATQEMPETHVAIQPATPRMPLALRALAESVLGEMNAAPAAVERRAA